MEIGLGELVVIFLFVLLFFGAKSIPDIARSLGKAIKEFRRTINEITEETSNIK